MIKRIFFDLDETLIHSLYNDPNQECIKFSLEDGLYYTIVRPSAKEVVKFAQELVGVENVYILTAATKDYAIEIVNKGDLGIDEKNIFSREDTERNVCYLPYSGTFCYMNEELGDPKNVLIDNMESYYNTIKTSYIGITTDRYLKVDNYYGVNDKEERFKEEVKNFLLSKIDK